MRVIAKYIFLIRVIRTARFVNNILQQVTGKSRTKQFNTGRVHAQYLESLLRSNTISLIDTRINTHECAHTCSYVVENTFTNRRMLSLVCLWLFIYGFLLFSSTQQSSEVFTYSHIRARNHITIASTEKAN